MIIRNLKNKKFGRLTVVGQVGITKHQKKLWLCKCNCGGKSITTTGDLINGTTKSCGCLQKERTSKANTKHGASYTRSYSIWSTMIRRCYNDRCHEFQRYGMRGVLVCDRWHNYKNFITDMGEPPSIELTLERINNDGNYTPENCKWATRHEQMRNTRHNVYINVNGNQYCLADAAKVLNIDPSTLSRRVAKCKIIREKNLKKLGLE